MTSHASSTDHPPVALTIGNFDGVHLGHQALIRGARARVGDTGRVIALCFHPHPMVALNPEHAPLPIEPFAIRARRLMALGVDEVVELSPTPERLAQSPQTFVDELVDTYRPRWIVEGHDFHFGKRRAGTPVVLRELAGLRGVGVDIVPPVEVALTDQSVVTASSTITRWLLDQGRARDAAFVLGRPHELVGEVVRGDQLGRTIAFPTANLSTDSLLPRDGVYAAVAELPSGDRVGAAINIGDRPTVAGTARRAEAHLIAPDASPLALPEGMPEYGWDLRLQLVSWVRDQVRFDGLDALRGQLGRDVQRIARTLRPLLGADRPGARV